MASHKIEARVTLYPPQISHGNISLFSGVGVNMVFRGNYYPGRILHISSAITSGNTGVALIGIIDDVGHDLKIACGDTMEMRDGPDRKIGDAEVLSIL